MLQNLIKPLHQESKLSIKKKLMSRRSKRIRYKMERMTRKVKRMKTKRKTDKRTKMRKTKFPIFKRQILKRTCSISTMSRSSPLPGKSVGDSSKRKTSFDSWKKPCKSSPKKEVTHHLLPVEDHRFHHPMLPVGVNQATLKRLVTFLKKIKIMMKRKRSPSRPKSCQMRANQSPKVAKSNSHAKNQNKSRPKMKFVKSSPKSKKTPGKKPKQPSKVMMKTRQFKRRSPKKMAKWSLIQKPQRQLPERNPNPKSRSRQPRGRRY